MDYGNREKYIKKQLVWSKCIFRAEVTHRSAGVHFFIRLDLTHGASETGLIILINAVSERILQSPVGTALDVQVVDHDGLLHGSLVGMKPCGVSRWWRRGAAWACSSPAESSSKARDWWAIHPRAWLRVASTVAGFLGMILIINGYLFKKYL